MKRPKIKWRSCTMREALQFASTRLIDESLPMNMRPTPPDADNYANYSNATMECFTDGSAVVCKSMLNLASCESDSDHLEEAVWWIGEHV